jgi:hypothetical protein
MSFPDFFFDQDDDCHWYQVPRELREVWSAWCDGKALDGTPLTEEERWDVPEGAERCDYPSFYIVREV